MRSRFTSILCVCLWLCLSLTAPHRVSADPSSEMDRRLDAWLDRNLADLLETYRQIHANPELSLEEEKTAARVANGLRAAGYEVITQIGGHGVAGVMKKWLSWRR